MPDCLVHLEAVIGRQQCSYSCVEQSIVEDVLRDLVEDGLRGSFRAIRVCTWSSRARSPTNEASLDGSRHDVKSANAEATMPSKVCSVDVPDGGRVVLRLNVGKSFKFSFRHAQLCAIPATMPSRSNEFRELVSSLAGSSSAKLPSESLRARRLRVKAAHTPLDQIDAADPTIDIWIVEARRVLSSLHSLSAFLRSIRRAYLDVSSSNATSSSRNKGKAVNKGQLDLSKGLLDAWRDIRWLDDRERDEVDYQAKTVLKSASQRVKELEQAEKSR